MLIAFMSDIHGNLPSLEAAVTDAESHGAEQIIVAGDITGYGPFPNDVCSFLKKKCISAIMGNYDQKVIEVMKQGMDATDGMKKKKQEILIWTLKHISAQNRRYLSGLPQHLDMKTTGGEKILVVHGSPVSMDDTIYPSITKRGLKEKIGDAHPEILVCGHTHIPFVKHIDGILVVNCGSTGYPVDGDPRPSYSLVQTKSGAAPSGRIIRFDYDIGRTIRAIEKTSLPKNLRKDFSTGAKRRFLQ
jgi:putative phosphoesterase